MRGNARRSEPRSVPRGIVRKTPEPVMWGSMTNLLRINEGEDQLQLTQGAAWTGAPIPSIGAE